MKIALVIERMDPLRGGREVYTARLAEALAARGHAVSVICQSASWEHAGVEIVALGKRGLGRSGRLRQFVAGAQQAIAAGGYDVSHAMLPVPGAGIYHPHGGTIPGQFEASLRRRSCLARPLVRALRPLNFARRVASELEQQVVADQRCTCLCVSEMIARQFERHYGLPSTPDGRVRVVFNSVTAPSPDEQRADLRQRLRYRMGLSQADTLFLVVATNFELKGVAQSIRAFAAFMDQQPRPVARLVVVGRELVEPYERLASLLNVRNDVVFIPPTKDIASFYSAADVMLLLTWYDPCSLVVLEAACWGIPSITTAFNGAAAVLGGAGIIVPTPDSRAEVASAMKTLADAERRAEYVKRCMELRPYLGMDRHVEELMRIYERIASEHV